MRVKVRQVKIEDEAGLVEMIAQFRVALAALRGKESTLDLGSAKEEMVDYQDKGYPIYLAEDETGEMVGYLVCRVDGEVVWAESLYVDPGWRQQGVGSMLYAKAERLAQELGGEWPYNWVDPENEAIIRFLGRGGYDVLNLVELRRPREGEEMERKVSVGSHWFRR